MARFMTAARLGVVVLLAIAILGAVGTYSFRDVSAAGRAGAAKVPALFQGNGHGGGNGNGGGNNGNGGGNGHGGVNSNQDTEQGADNGNGHGKKDKKAKKNKAKDQADDSGTPTADEDAGSHKNPQAGNVDCDDVEGMIEYLKNRNMNGAIHANENGADNAAAGALNKCMEHGPENADSESEDGTPVADEASPVAESGTPVAEYDVEDGGSDKPVSVNVDIDEDVNGTIEYDLDGDGEPDLTMIVEDGKVVEYVEAGDAADATPEATPDTERPCNSPSTPMRSTPG